MNDVKRFKRTVPTGDGTSAIRDVVLASDFDAAQSELAALREELATAERGLANSKLALDAQTHNYGVTNLRLIGSEQRLAVVERQPYGYWICPKGNPKLGSFHHEVLDTTEQYCEVTKLYTSQPAPVAVAVPDGWKLVPIEPTAEMIEAAINTPVADTGDDVDDQPQDYRNMWTAMIDKVKELNQ